MMKSLCRFRKSPRRQSWELLVRVYWSYPGRDPDLCWILLFSSKQRPVPTGSLGIPTTGKAVRPGGERPLMVSSPD